MPFSFLSFMFSIYLLGSAFAAKDFDGHYRICTGENDYSFNDAVCYTTAYSRAPENYDDSEAFCNSLYSHTDAHLSIFHSTEEFDFFLSEAWSGAETWVGMKKNLVDEVYENPDGSTFDFMPPDDTTDGWSGEPCYRIRNSEVWDLNCGSDRRLSCSTPIPTCNGVPANHFNASIHSTLVCSGHGFCYTSTTTHPSGCVCDTGYAGSSCTLSSASGDESSTDSGAIVAGVLVPIFSIILIAIIIIVTILIILYLRKKSGDGMNSNSKRVSIAAPIDDDLEAPSWKTDDFGETDAEVEKAAENIVKRSREKYYAHQVVNEPVFGKAPSGGGAGAGGDGDGGRQAIGSGWKDIEDSPTPDFGDQDIEDPPIY